MWNGISFICTQFLLILIHPFHTASLIFLWWHFDHVLFVPPENLSKALFSFFLSLNTSRNKCIILPLKDLSQKTDSINEIFYVVTSTCNLYVHSRQMEILSVLTEAISHSKFLPTVYFSLEYPLYSICCWNPAISDDLAGTQLLPRSLGSSPVPQWIKNPPAVRKMQEMKLRPLGQEGPMEEDMATLFTTLAWRIPWTEEPSGLQSIELQKAGHDRSDGAHKKPAHLRPSSELHMRLITLSSSHRAIVDAS